MRTRQLEALALLLAGVLLVGLSAVVEFPGERPLKETLGFDYGPPECKKVPGDGPAGRWRAEGLLPSRRDEARAVAVGGGAYIAGGIGSDEPPVGRSIRTFERYSFATHHYASLPPLPIPLNHLGLAAVGEDIYVIGGQAEAGGQVTATNRAFRYRVKERRWEELAPMRHARGAHGLAVVGQRIYVIGGRQDRVFLRSQPNVAAVESFDTASGRWMTHASMPLARDHLGVAVHQGKVYALGGRLPDGTAVARLDRYDPVSDRWTQLSDAPLSTSGMNLLEAAGRLVFAGGEEPLEGRVYGAVWAFDPATDRWRPLPPLPSPRHGYASVAAEDRVYLFGGSTCPGFHPTVDSSSLALPFG